MKQKEILENLTGEKMPEPTQQEQKRIQIERTPFWVIGKKHNYNIIMGKYKFNQEPLDLELELTNIHDTPLTDYEIEILAKDWLHHNLFNTILSMILCVTTDLLNNKTNN